jgi:hypothetical protein
MILRETSTKDGFAEFKSMVQDRYLEVELDLSGVVVLVVEAVVFGAAIIVADDQFMHDWVRFPVQRLGIKME